MQGTQGETSTRRRGLRRQTLALGGLTLATLAMAWLAFRISGRPGPASPVVPIEPPMTVEVLTTADREPSERAPEPPPAVKTQSDEAAPVEPAPPLAVPEGVGFGPGLGTRVTPDAQPAPEGNR